MENEACAEKVWDGDGDVEVEKVKEPPVVTVSPYRYSKEELLAIKELPCSNERPECLADKYDSDGVWDPEKWHASLYPTSERTSPVEGFKKDYLEERAPLKRRIPDPRERLKEDDLDVVLSPQRRSFGGGCQGIAAPAPLARRPISPLENKENESLRLGGARRIGSGRIIPARAFERESRMEKERERERDFKDKRFRRDFGDKRVFSERRRNDSYAEEEPEWFSGGPTSQSETIELIGFDDKILEDDKRRSKRSRRRTESLKEECNGGLPEEPDVVRDSTADQEVPHPEVLPEQSGSDFDFNEFFNLEKTMPGLASHPSDPAVVSMSEVPPPAQQQKNIFHVCMINIMLNCRSLASQRQARYRVLPPLLQTRMRALSMAVNHADLEALAYQQELGMHAHHQYQQCYNKQAQDKSFRNRQTRTNHSPGPGSHQGDRNSPGNAITSMISASFTPTSVIRKMYETKEKTRDEQGSRPDGKEEAIHCQDDGGSLNPCLGSLSGGGPQPGGPEAGAQNMPGKDERLKPGSAGHQVPPMVPSGPGSAYPRPMYQVPLLSHLPMGRPPPPQLHPSVVQRMLAQGIQPQPLGPALMQSGMFPSHMDLAQLRGLPPTLLGPPLYPLSATGNPLLPPRANAQMQLAVMQQQLQQQRQGHPGAGVSHSQNHGHHRTNAQRHGASPPLGLAKWFGSDVLQQPLPSMPAKVISVDELEFRP
uniref:Eukaryotic translation initiation factor 4E nuclear import factor 1 n=1 Tax=Gadus morhua TaxID=8049 RepID=A0A8C5AB44_GADMO